MAAAALVLALAPAVLAADSAVTASGEVHGVTVEKWVESSGVLGATALLHTVQRPDGESTTVQVPGTDDLDVEADPAIDIDPVTDQPVLVWSRNQGYGFDIVVSRFEDGAWTEPVSVYSDGADNLASQIRVGRNLVHVVFEQDDPSGNRRFRLCLDRSTLEPAMPVEKLPTSSPNAVPGDGGPGSGSEPAKDYMYFSSEIFPPDEDNGRIVVWGARDEPIPITYFEVFELPSEVGGARDTSAGFISDSFVNTFVSGSRFYYSKFRNRAWTDLRMITLGDGRNVADARILLRKMIEREERSLPE